MGSLCDRKVETQRRDGAWAPDPHGPYSPPHPSPGCTPMEPELACRAAPGGHGIPYCALRIFLQLPTSALMAFCTPPLWPPPASILHPLIPELLPRLYPHREPGPLLPIGTSFQLPGPSSVPARPLVLLRRGCALEQMSSQLAGQQCEAESSLLLPLGQPAQWPGMCSVPLHDLSLLTLLPRPWPIHSWPCRHQLRACVQASHPF